VRWLPHWQGDILCVRTNDVCVLRGIRGLLGRVACGVVALWTIRRPAERESRRTVVGGDLRDDEYAVGTVRRALRNPDVVDASVEWLMVSTVL
jgi:hypothetical protein